MVNCHSLYFLKKCLLFLLSRNFLLIHVNDRLEINAIFNHWEQSMIACKRDYGVFCEYIVALKMSVQTCIIWKEIFQNFGLSTKKVYDSKRHEKYIYHFFFNYLARVFRKPDDQHRYTRYTYQPFVLFVASGFLETYTGGKSLKKTNTARSKMVRPL